MREFVVTYEPIEDGCWLVRIPEVPGCLTQAESIEEGREFIREALWAAMGDEELARAAEFKEFIPLVATAA